VCPGSFSGRGHAPDSVQDPSSKSFGPGKNRRPRSASSPDKQKKQSFRNRLRAKSSSGGRQDGRTMRAVHGRSDRRFTTCRAGSGTFHHRAERLRKSANGTGPPNQGRGASRHIQAGDFAVLHTRHPGLGSKASSMVRSPMWKRASRQEVDNEEKRQLGRQSEIRDPGERKCVGAP